jgi:hypothetical protein
MNSRNMNKSRVSLPLGKQPKSRHDEEEENEEDFTHDDIEDSYEPEEDEEVDLDDIEKEAELLKITREFQEMVVKFVKIDDVIRKKEAEIKELKSQKKPCEGFIIEYLDKIGESVIEITGGKLRKSRTETKGTLTQDIIKKAIDEKVKDPDQVQQILSLMENMRPKKERVNLKRTALRDKRVKRKNGTDNNSSYGGTNDE